MSELLSGFLILALAGLFYFIPAICAYSGDSKNKEAILILNIFLGWTGLGWIIALIWAAMK